MPHRSVILDTIHEYKRWYNSKEVITFDTQDRLDDKIDKFTSMMSKLTAQGDTQHKQFKPQIYQGKMRGHTRNYHHQGNY